MSDEPPDYRSTWGATDGPIRVQDRSPAMGIYLQGELMPVGIAFPFRSVADRRGSLQVFRLSVKDVPLDGLYLCVCRRFVRLGDAAELE